jgi:TRAP-type C4-dicarboxylate transport system permease small subunit
MFKYLSAFLDRLEKVCIIIGSAMLFAMVVIMGWQVILRYVFSKSNVWAEEISRYLFIGETLLVAFVGSRRDNHLKMDFFLRALPKRISAIVDLLLNVSIIILLVVLQPYAIQLWRRAFTSYSSSLPFPMAVPYAPIVLGIFFLILAHIERLVIQIKGLASKGVNDLKEGGVQS